MEDILSYLNFGKAFSFNLGNYNLPWLPYCGLRWKWRRSTFYTQERQDAAI